MKKLLAVVLSVALLLMTAVSFAEQAAVTEVAWSSMEEAANKLGGELAPLSDLGVQMFFPTAMQKIEVTEEEVETGLFLKLKSEEPVLGMTAQLVKTDINAFLKDAQEKGATGMREMKINGIPCINFNLDQEGLITTCVALSAGDGSSVILLAYAPAGEETKEMIQVMVASLQPVAQ